MLSRPTGQIPRGRVIEAPLVSRPISAAAYDREGRRRLLMSFGVPERDTDPYRAQILLVSFGGQSIPRPSSRSPSPSPSRPVSPATSPTEAATTLQLPTRVGLLPPGWIAIVCGIAAPQGLSDNALAEDLPPNFYAIPPDAYVPDLTAIADVVLGKLVRPSSCFPACPSLM